MVMEREMAEVEMEMAKAAEEGDSTGLWTAERKQKILQAMRAAAQAAVENPDSEEAKIAVAKAKAEIAEMQEAVAEAKARGELTAAEEKELREWGDEQAALLETAVEGGKVDYVVRMRQEQEALEQVENAAGECATALATAISEGGLDDSERSARVKAKAEGLREAVSNACACVNAHHGPPAGGSGSDDHHHHHKGEKDDYEEDGHHHHHHHGEGGSGGSGSGSGSGGDGSGHHHHKRSKTGVFTMNEDARRRLQALNRVLETADGLGEADSKKYGTSAQDQQTLIEAGKAIACVEKEVTEVNAAGTNNNLKEGGGGGGGDVAGGMWGTEQKKEVLEHVRKAVEEAMDHADAEETQLCVARANEKIREMKEAVEEAGKKKGDVKPAEAKELTEWAGEQEKLLEAVVSGGRISKVVKLHKQEEAFNKVGELTLAVEKALEQAIAEGGLDDPERAARVKAKAEELRQAIEEAQALLDENSDDPEVQRKRAALERVMESAEGVGTVGPGQPTAEEQQVFFITIF